jgi:hypothetical protein
MTTLVFVHGYSVTNLNAYGELPLRLQAEATDNGLEIDVKQIFLGRYISFHDEVSLGDISLAFDTAIKEQLAGINKFICITHSTGAPVVRDWWNRYYDGLDSPISHLIMLAPANFGSALAKLGKGKLSRLKSWFDGVEPGQKVLNWLMLGSKEAWDLNKKWITSDGAQIGPNGIFPFVITGQAIDRKLYDNLNSYTGELGSDGVVRTATTNLTATYIKLLQEASADAPNKPVNISSTFKIDIHKESPAVPLRVVAAKSHSGNDMGIMKSVKRDKEDVESKETVAAIFDCIKVSNKTEYDLLVKKFETETDLVQKNELIEIEKELLIADRHFIHDRYSQVIFRVTDTEDYPVCDFDLIFTAGENNDPNHLPPGFAIDRQQNSNNPETITYFFNYDVINGAPKNALREELKGISLLGLRINPRPTEGFVRFVPCEIIANKELLDIALKPNSTTLIDIVLQRVVSKEVFRMEKTDGNTVALDFSDVKWENKSII